VTMFRALKCAVLRHRVHTLTMQLYRHINRHCVAGSEVVAAQFHRLRDRSSFFQTRCIPAPILNCACWISWISFLMAFDTCCWCLPKFHGSKRRERVRCTRQVGHIESIGRNSSSMADVPMTRTCRRASFVHSCMLMPGNSHHTDTSTATYLLGTFPVLSSSEYQKCLRRIGITPDWRVQGKTTRIYYDHLDRYIGHCRSPAATLISSTAASRWLVVAQYPCHISSYVTTCSRIWVFV
jgi:hypothetical protein